LLTPSLHDGLPICFTFFSVVILLVGLLNIYFIYRMYGNNLNTAYTSQKNKYICYPNFFHVVNGKILVLQYYKYHIFFFKESVFCENTNRTVCLEPAANTSGFALFFQK